MRRGRLSRRPVHFVLAIVLLLSRVCNVHERVGSVHHTIPHRCNTTLAFEACITWRPTVLHTCLYILVRSSQEKNGSVQVSVAQWPVLPDCSSDATTIRPHPPGVRHLNFGERFSSQRYLFTLQWTRAQHLLNQIHLMM